VGPEASARLRDAAKVIGWGLLLYGGVLLVGSKLQAKAFGSIALQMVMAEWGAGRLAVAWSDPAADPPTSAAVAKRAGRGVTLGLAAAGAVLVFSVATHGLVAHANSPAPAQLAMGFITAALVAARDELLLRGIVIRAFRKACPTLALLLVCGGAGAAAEYGVLAGTDAGNPASFAIAGLLGVVFASLWLVDRGGWLPLGAHAAWTTATGTLIRGGLFDLRAEATPWGGGDAGPLGSTAVLVALLPVAALAAAWALRVEKK
jgi:membrane protease YdiL (CAAX protease family)